MRTRGSASWLAAFAARFAPLAPFARAARWAPVALAAAALAWQLAAAGCSATSEPVGNGACDGFCTKVVNLRCRQTFERDACVAACVHEQKLCPESESELIRCATNEGAIACDTSTLGPHIVACDPAINARDACLYAPDAGVGDGPLLPYGL